MLDIFIQYFGINILYSYKINSAAITKHIHLRYSGSNISVSNK